MLGAIESLLSAVVADRMSGDRHNSNMELVAQGVANVSSPLFGGLPATGAIARTATNIRSGARTPVAGDRSRRDAAADSLFAAPLARHIPLAVLAAMLMVGRVQHGGMARNSRYYTAGAIEHHRLVCHVRAHGAAADLTVAVEAGMILAAPIFIRR